jgi:DNA-binding NarL/FixJ family response regulator
LNAPDALVSSEHDPNKEIERLSVSEETVKGQNILSKLGANDQTHAVMIGLKR